MVLQSEPELVDLDSAKSAWSISLYKCRVSAGRSPQLSFSPS